MLQLTTDDFTDSLPEPIKTGRLTVDITDALALAVRIAPCLASTEDPAILAAAKAILRQAVRRRYESGSGITTQQTAGPYSQSVETRGSMRMFLPSEEADLRALCAESASRAKAFGVDTAGGTRPAHRPWCALYFGATYCSCGASLTLDQPLWEP